MDTEGPNKHTDLQSTVSTGMSPWTAKEDSRLSYLYKKYDGDWFIIREEMPGRSKRVCEQRIHKLDPELYHTFHKPQNPSYPWTANEKRVLTALCDLKTPLAELPSYLPGRSYTACTKMKKGLHQETLDIGEGPKHKHDMKPWTAPQIRKLVEHKMANMSWAEISKALGSTHSEKECRTQWFDYFWEDFKLSIVNGEFDIEKYKEIIKRGGGVKEVDDEADAKGDTDDEQDLSDGEASGIAALAPEDPMDTRM